MARKIFQTLLIVAAGLEVFYGMAIADVRNAIEFVRYSPQHINVNTGLTFAPMLTEGYADASLEYRWFLNGKEVLHVIAEHFPGSQLSRGDQVAVEITPVLPGGERLRVFTSEPFEVGNAKPVITSDPSSALTANGFSYHVTATDPDSDTLVFSLDQAPEGMSIDAVTGQISWIFETATEGVFPVRIVVDDGYDGHAAQVFDLTLSSE